MYKLISEQGIWQELLHSKYLRTKTLAEVQAKPMDSPFWKGLMQVKDSFFVRGVFKVGNGAITRFWEYIWLGDVPLAQQYPTLYNIVQRKNISVHDVLSHNPLNIGFRRNLHGSKWNAWLHLCQRLMQVTLTNEPDVFWWNLTTNGVFTVKSMYEDWMNDHQNSPKKYLWKLKIPLKIKIFMWFLREKVLLTKDNLLKRNWNGCKKCCFLM